MNAVGLWVANLPGAYVRVPLFGVGPMLLAPTQPRSWRPPQPPLHSSAAASSIGRSAESPLLPPRPNVLIAGDGRGFAVRGNDGRFAIHHIGGDSFAVANGSRPMPMAATCTTKAWGRGSFAMRPAASASSLTGAGQLCADA